MVDLKQKEVSTSLLKKMESTAARMRELIVAMPPLDLLGYLYSQFIMKAMADTSSESVPGEVNVSDDLIIENQFLLEYVHAVLSTDVAPAKMSFSESSCAELFKLGRELRNQAMYFAMATSAGTKDGIFGTDTADIEFRAKSNWIIIRGSRYPVLEGEFYRYILAPHNDVLEELYGVSAADIADGFQAMANATRTGHANAILEVKEQFETAEALATSLSKPLEEVLGSWAEANTERVKAVSQAIDDMLRGGVANVSRHTKLPPGLLADLAYKRGEETEFFADGEFAGTPYRTLPARKKPLIQLGSNYYAVDPCFARDSGYRALLHNLLLRKSGYRKTFDLRQKTMSEAAFADILADQLPGATVFHEVYYKDSISGQWSENDCVILVDDVLFLVEAKAGAAASIASPALDFDRHARSVQDLVIKAYKQCERFFNYLNSADEVPLYRLVAGKHEVCGRLRRSLYRVMLPIGLTVESFSPFSSCCKELPQIKPLLGKHAFVSLSIDDLFVLKRFLPTPGAFSHYMEVRQAVAGMRRVHLFDEIDHLGAYLKKNRFDLEIAEQLTKGNLNMLVWDGMSDIVDRSFEGEDWESRHRPGQNFPEEVVNLLGGLDRTRGRGWLAAESHIRDLGEEGRDDLAKMLSNLRETLNTHPYRYFLLSGDGKPIFIWLQKHNHSIDLVTVNEKASASALAAKAKSLISLVAVVSADGTYQSVQCFTASIPMAQTEENAHIYEDAARMAQPTRTVYLKHSKKIEQLHEKCTKPRRNDKCPCGSGVKYKKCHGAIETTAAR